MNNSYISSIVTKYGDLDNVRRDAKTLNEIQSRQGASLLIDAVAEATGRAVNEFSMSAADRKRLVDSLILEFKDALLERT